MSNLDDIYACSPFSFNHQQKEDVLSEQLKTLSIYHRKHCPEYRRILDVLGIDLSKVSKTKDIPFIPVALFKQFELKTITREDIFKITTSSGTSGQAVSKIFLDKQTAANQQKVLVKIVSDFIRYPRMPMLIIDSPNVVKDRTMFSARGAGILGFSIFGTDRAYALNDRMEIDVDAIEAFLVKHRGKPILLFGFTFMVWQFFYKKLQSLGKNIDLSNGVLIHGGGWKKLVNEAVSKEEFKRSLYQVCGLKDIHDYYGMVEQTGCIYMECQYGHLHASNFSEVFIRNSKDFSVCKKGKKGLIQVLSVLPESYPGHSLLTEDEGVMLGEDDCPCGRKGKYFQVLGRIKNAEIRGCSDTYERG